LKIKILYVLILVLISLVFLQAGYIVRDIERDDTRERVISLKDKFQNHEGRITSIETIVGNGSKPFPGKKKK
jgi:hypothetical protein